MGLCEKELGDTCHTVKLVDFRMSIFLVFRFFIEIIAMSSFFFFGCVGASLLHTGFP